MKEILNLSGKLVSKLPDAVSILSNTIKKWPWWNMDRVNITISASEIDGVMHVASATIFKNLSTHYIDK